MPAHIIDMATTMLELAGVSRDALNGSHPAPGISLLSQFEKDAPEERPPLFFHHERKNALRHGKWKITTIDHGEEWELYDLSKDRGETRNLADKNPDKLDQMVKLWESRRDTIVQQISGTEE